MTPKPEDPQIAVMRAKYKEARAALKADYEAVMADAYAAYQERLLKLRDDYNKAVHAHETQITPSQAS